MAVADRVAICLHTFAKCLNSIREAQRTKDQAKVEKAISDELDRLKVWSGNIGAHRRGKSSLDYKLREASVIRGRVLNLLDDLVRSVNDANDIIIGRKLPWEELEESHSLPPEIGRDGDDDMALTELDQISLDLNEIITSLFRLSLTMRGPLLFERFLKSGTPNVAAYSKYDISHVQSKFPSAPNFLCGRLGKANSQRRQFLKYRSLHHEKLSQGLTGEFQETGTVASSVPTILKDAALAMQSNTQQEHDTVSDFARSETSYASSAASSTRLRVPSLPENNMDGTPFECRYCHSIIEISSRIAWKKHVFKDLQPYVCIARTCSTSEKTFASRGEWSEHQLELHWREWDCTFGCSQSFETREDLKRHFSLSHPHAVDKEQMDALISISERKVDPCRPRDCPLCDEILDNLKAFDRHVGRHLEDVALFTLPEEDEEDGEKEEKEERSESDDGEDRTVVDKVSVPVMGQAAIQARTRTMSSPSRRVSCEMVVCHECENEWYRQEHGLTCPDCSSEFVEVVSRLSATEAVVEEEDDVLNPASMASAANRHDQPRYGASSYGQPPQQQQPQYSNSPAPQPPSHHDQGAANPGSYGFWIPEEGVRRDVIQADIQLYLGPGAVAKPGNGVGENSGRKGYYLAGSRNFTSSMLTDLKTDSANFNRSGARGNYTDSQVHQSRQYYGPTGLEQPMPPRFEQPQAYNQPTNPYASLTPTATVGAPSTHGSRPSHLNYHPTNPYASLTPTATAGAPSTHGSRPNHLNYQQSTRDRPENSTLNSTGYYEPSSPPPDHYLASDGNYYPTSQMPSQATTLQQDQTEIPAALQRVMRHLDPNPPIRLQPSPLYYPPPPESISDSAGRRRSRGSQSNRDFIRNLEDRTLEEGFLNSNHWQ